MQRFSTAIAILLASLIPLSAMVQTKEKPSARKPPPLESSPPKRDNYGDPLPEGAMARLGTIRFRENGPVYSVAFSPDGKFVATTSQFETRIWETLTGKRLHRFDVSGSRSSFAKNGKHLLTFSANFPIDRSDLLLWNFQKEKIVQKFETRNFSPNGTYGYFLRFDLHPDGKRIVGYVNTGAVFLIDRSSRVAELLSQADEKRFHYKRNAFSLSPEGSRIAIGKDNGTIHILDVPQRGKISRQKGFHLEGSKGKVVAVTFFGANILAASILDRDWKTLEDGETITIRNGLAIDLWDVAKKKRLATLKPPQDRKQIGPTVFSPDGKILYVLTKTGIDLWNLKKHKITGHIPFLQSSNFGLNGIAISNDGKYLAAAAHMRMVQLWKLPEKKSLLPKELGHTSQVGSMVWTPDGEHLITINRYKSRILFWNPVKGTVSKKFVYWKNSGRIGDVAVSNDGRTLAAVGIAPEKAGVPSQLLKIWDIASGKVLREFRREVSFHKVALSADGSLIACGDYKLSTQGYASEAIQVFRTKTGERIANFEFPSASLYKIAFTVGSNNIWVATRKQGLSQWNIRKGKEFKTLQPLSQIEAVAFSQHAEFACVKTKNKGFVPGKLKLLTLPEGKEKEYSLLDTPNHYFPYRLQYVSISQFGQLIAAKRIAANRYANAVDVIDTVIGQRIFTTGPIDDIVTDTEISPDGNKLATALYDGTILIWKVYDKLSLSNGKMDDSVLQKSWEMLALSDKSKVWQSIDLLSSHPAPTIAFLSAKMFPEKNDLPQDTKKRIEELESKSFAKRRQAFTKLKSYGSPIMRELQNAVKNANSSELKARLLQLIEASDSQNLRSVQILERIGAAKAKPLMEKLALGAPKAKQTIEAKRILSRWSVQENKE